MGCGVGGASFVICHLVERGGTYTNCQIDSSIDMWHTLLLSAVCNPLLAQTVQNILTTSAPAQTSLMSQLSPVHVFPRQSIDRSADPYLQLAGPQATIDS